MIDYEVNVHEKGADENGTSKSCPFYFFKFTSISIKDKTHFPTNSFILLL